MNIMYNKTLVFTGVRKNTGICQQMLIFLCLVCWDRSIVSYQYENDLNPTLGELRLADSVVSYCRCGIGKSVSPIFLVVFLFLSLKWITVNKAEGFFSK